MANLKLKHSDISDNNLFKLATLHCFPSIDWLFYRSTKYSGLKRENVQKLIRKIKTLYKNNGVSYPFNNYSFSNLSNNSLFKWHPFLLDLKLNNLVHPLNGVTLNKKILRSSKANSPIRKIVTPINFKKVKLNGDFISPSELNKLCTSLVLLNWEYKSSIRKRPNEDYLNFFIDQDILEGDKDTFKKIILHLDAPNLNEVQIRFILNFVSRELIFFLKSLSFKSLESLRRTYFVSDKLLQENSDKDLSKLSPSYSILKDSNLDNIILLEKLAILGYKKIGHLDFLENEILRCLLNQTFSNKLTQIKTII
ncbi:MAG: hypothetical protein VX169_05315 [Pseudomonadota bacterium]|nr:hypothetical protein [Pseudomonadota bacterium]